MIDFEYYKNTFAERVKELISGKSILAFSKEIGVPERTVNGWLNKKSTPRFKYMVTLALYFGCSIDYLAGLEN